MGNFNILSISSECLPLKSKKIHDYAKEIANQNSQNTFKKDKEKLKKDWETIRKDFPL